MCGNVDLYVFYVLLSTQAWRKLASRLKEGSLLLVHLLIIEVIALYDIYIYVIYIYIYIL